MNEGLKNIFDKICSMENASGRLGFEIVEAQSGQFWESDSYETVGESVISLVRNNPEQIELIEKVLIAITGYGFESTKIHMDEHEDYYNSL